MTGATHACKVCVYLPTKIITFIILYYQLIKLFKVEIIEEINLGQGSMLETQTSCYDPNQRSIQSGKH